MTSVFGLTVVFQESGSMRTEDVSAVIAGTMESRFVTPSVM
jgi:hypothetical protein